LRDYIGIILMGIGNDLRDLSRRRSILGQRWNHPWHPGDPSADTGRREFKTAPSHIGLRTESAAKRCTRASELRALRERDRAAPFNGPPSLLSFLRY